jgi:hypothetical protein
VLTSRTTGAAVLAAIVFTSACEIEKVSIPRTESQLAMHSVLSASAPSQVVLLERTRNGSVGIIGPPFDLPDLVVNDEGIAERNASVSLTMPNGQTIFALEEHIIRGDGKGRGIYRFALPGSSLDRGGVYRLRVQTTGGDVITAETAVPEGTAAIVAEPRDFDRASDSVMVEWPASPGARSYFVRIETPFGPRSFFTDSTKVRLTGDLRNVDAIALPHVFIPGFPQAVTVSAVDSNYYDWYRTHNNRLTGTGVVNRVTGAIGVFGSLVRLRFQDFSVVAPQADPGTGRFRFIGTAEQAAATPYLSMNLYVESRAARGDQPDALSGRYDVRPRFGYVGCLTCGLLGTVKDGRVELALLSGWFAKDTTDVFVGEIRGDTLVGNSRGFGGPWRFVKAP